MTSDILVIDFGTSTSSAVVLRAGADGPGVMVPEPGTGLTSWPSSVYRLDDHLLIGTSAERRKQVEPDSYRAEFKRELGSTRPVLLGDRSYPVVDLVSAVLQALREAAEKVSECTLDHAVLTVPASNAPGDSRRTLMREAAGNAGFRTIELVAEPVAAAFAPDITQRDGLVLVHDLGGGTFDTALVRFEEQRVEVLCHAALDDCGGVDIDALLAARVREQGKEWMAALEYGAEMTSRLRIRAAVGDLVRRVKHRLSEVGVVQDYLAPTTPESSLTRGELDELVRPIIERTLSCVRDLLTGSGHSVDDLTLVVPVGGGARMPQIPAMLEHRLGRPVHRVAEPETAVVRGAAAWVRRRRTTRTDTVTLTGVDARPLRWAVPGVATVNWIVGRGEGVPGRGRVGTARLADGSLWDLVVDDDPVVVERTTSQDELDATAVLARPDRLPITKMFCGHGEESVGSIVFSPDGRQLLTSTSLGSNNVWHTAGDSSLPKPLHSWKWFLAPHAALGQAIVIDPGRTQPAAVRNLATGEILRELRPVGASDAASTAVAVSRDGSIAATSDEIGVHIWSLANGEYRTLTVDQSSARHLEFGVDGTLLIVGGWSRGHERRLVGRVTEVDIATGTVRRSLDLDMTVVERPPLTPDLRLESHHVLTGGTIDPARRHLATLSRPNHSADSPTNQFSKAMIWDLGSGSRLHVLDNDAITVQFSPDGTLLLVSSTYNARIYETRSYRPVHEQRGIGPDAMSPDGRWLATTDSTVVSLLPVDPGILAEAHRRRPQAL